MVDEADVRDLLSLYKIGDLRTLIDEKGISYKSNSKEDLIDVLIEEHDWTDDEYNELVDRYQRIVEGKRPLGHYLFRIVSVDLELESVSERLLERNEATFDESGDLNSTGYQIGSLSDSRLEATKWRYEEEKQFDPLTDDVQTSVKKDKTGVIVDLDEGYIKVQTSNYQRAKGIGSTFEELGFTLGTIGHSQELSERANEEVEEFVDELESRLESIREGESD